MEYVDIKFTCSRYRIDYNYILPLGQFEIRRIVEPLDLHYTSNEQKRNQQDRVYRYQINIYSNQDDTSYGGAKGSLHDISFEDWNRIRHQLA
jgi:hypothetical protein